MTTKPSTKIAVSELDKLGHLLDQIPPHHETAISKQKAIALLAPKLHAMRAKGYSWNDVAAWLMDNGLSVTRVALQGYLRRTGRVEARARPGAARKPRQRIPGSPASGSPPLAGAPPVSTSPPAPAAAHAPQRIKDDIERRYDPSARRSQFNVRPDTENI